MSSATPASPAFVGSSEAIGSSGGRSTAAQSPWGTASVGSGFVFGPPVVAGPGDARPVEGWVEGTVGLPHALARREATARSSTARVAVRCDARDPDQDLDPDLDRSLAIMAHPLSAGAWAMQG